MKQVYDRHHTDRVFQVGSLVYVSLMPLRQTSLASIDNSKLAHRYHGPYEVIERIGPVAYRLALPPGSLVHPVFHVSRLRQFMGDPLSVANVAPVPLIEPAASEVPSPAFIIDRRRVRRSRRIVTEVLVAWQGQPLEDATWLLEDDFLARFPSWTP